MAQDPTEDQFNAAVSRVVATAPEGLSEEAFNRLVDQELTKSQGFSQYGPLSQLLRDQAQGGARPSQAENESAPTQFGMAGGMVAGPVGAGIGGGIGSVLGQYNSGQGISPLRVAKDAALQAGGAYVGDKVIAPAVSYVGGKIAGMADPLIQRAIKPALSDLRAAAGSAGTTVAQQAQRMANFVKRSGVRTAEQAEQGIQGLERRIDSMLRDQNVSTDAPTRAVRYLNATERGASRQMNPHPDTAQVASTRDQFVRTSPLFRDEVTYTPREVASSILDESGRPMMRTEMQASSVRVPREDVGAREALDLARGTSRYGTKRAFGEIKGMGVESEKALTRAGRDAAKSAVPEIRPLLKNEQELIRLKPVLDRMALRTGNRDTMSLGGIAGAAPAMAQGKVPFLGMAAQTLRNSQLPAGLLADAVGHGIQRSAPTMGKLAQPIPAATLEYLVRLAQIEALGQDQ